MRPSAVLLAGVQQQEQPSSSCATRASFIQRGGRSASTTSTTGLKTLKARGSSGLGQKLIAVCTGGNPGRSRVTSSTRTAAPGASANRARVQLFTCRMAVSNWTVPAQVFKSIAALQGPESGGRQSVARSASGAFSSVRWRIAGHKVKNEQEYN